MGIGFKVRTSLPFRCHNTVAEFICETFCWPKLKACILECTSIFIGRPEDYLNIDLHRVINGFMLTMLITNDYEC